MRKFRKIYIEITNACNLSCSFCPKTTRPLAVMSPQQFQKAVQQLKPYGDNFYLHVMGEPLSHPHLPQLLEIAQQENIKINVTTNGTLLCEKGGLLLQNKVRLVSVSLHSFEANHLNQDMLYYLQQVVDFCKQALQTTTIVELRLWNMDRESLYDVNQLNGQIIQYFQNQFELEFDLQQQILQKFAAEENTNKRKHNLRLKDNIYLGMAEHFNWPNINQPVYPECEGFCYGLRNQIAILVDGTVVPCCLDSEGTIALGNVFQQPLEEILSQGRAKRLYDGFSQRKAIEPLCRTCGYMKKFL